MTAYKPFLGDAAMAATLNGRRFVVIRAPDNLRQPYRDVQDRLKERTRGLRITYPSYPHITVGEFAAGTSLAAVQEAAALWARDIEPLHVEALALSFFPAPHQVLILEVRTTPSLLEALTKLRERAEAQRLDIATEVAPWRWRFHLSVAYCSKLEAAQWREVVDSANDMDFDPVSGDVVGAEVVAFDGGSEHSGGVYLFGRGATPEITRPS